MNTNNLYAGREHSLVKHKLLEGYLEKLLFIVARGGVREITYVDCFSGPWGDESENLEGTSISISLNILSKVKSTLNRLPNNKTNTKFRAIFIEKDKNNYKKLKKFLDEKCPDDIECHHINGDYFDCQDEILKLCGKGFSFFFVDPKGWVDIGVSKLQKLLERPNSEFLINFMYDFLNRAVGMEAFRVQVAEMIGELSPADVKELESINKDMREDKIVNCYRERLKKMMPTIKMNKPRSYYSTVLDKDKNLLATLTEAEIVDKDKNRTKYHMVYLTSHPKGIVEFSRISENIEIFQRKVRCQTRIDRKQKDTGMVDMFGAGDESFHESDNVNIDVVRDFWLKNLDKELNEYTETKLADILEETGWLESDLQQAFGELIKENKVENIDIKGKRISKYIHFNKNERLRRLN